MEQPAADLILRKGADRRLRAGHLWVYSNEVDGKHSPLGEFRAGDPVTVRNVDGKLLGSAYMEPQSLICARLYAPGEQRALDQVFFQSRFETALAGRQSAFDKPFYRLVYGDSDTLPGLVIDRFGDYLVVQLNNEGIERHREPLLQALIAVIQPGGILLRGDSRSRREQGLADDSEVVHGEVPAQVALEENGVQFLAPVHAGQARLQPGGQRRRDEALEALHRHVGGVRPRRPRRRGIAAARDAAAHGRLLEARHGRRH